MSFEKSILFDAPGPRAKRLMLVVNVLGAAVLLALFIAVLMGLAEKGQLNSRMWAPFLTADAWEFYLLPGLLKTLQAAGIAIVASMLFGIVFGVGRLARNPLIRGFTGAVVEFLRAVPVLLMMIFIWLALSDIGIVPDGQSSFYSVVIALTLYNGSVMAELVRSGVNALPKGQGEAAMVIGMTRSASLRHVELPQALLAMMPSMISQFVIILKDSALGYIIGFSELLLASRLLGSANGNILPALLVAGVIFILINILLGWLAQKSSGLLSRRSGKELPTPVSVKVI